MSMVIMAFSVIIAILSLCILTKNQNLHNLNEIVLANIKNLQNQRAPENFQKMTDDFENGVEIIDAKISNTTEDAEEFEYPSTYYSGKNLYLSSYEVVFQNCTNVRHLVGINKKPTPGSEIFYKFNSEPGFISQDEHYVLTYQYGYDLVDILYPTRSPQKMDVEDQVSQYDYNRVSKNCANYP